ncbi:MAG: iron chaperone [Anaerorhabdus sp.]
MFNKFLEEIPIDENREKLKTILDWVSLEFPQLEKRVAWGQPMFTNNDTFIIGFSVAKNHIAVSPEKVALDKFSVLLTDNGYEYGKMLFKIKWSQDINFDVLKQIIEFNIIDKKDVSTFWRK